MKLLTIDPSELLRPESEFASKPVARFRDYTIDPEDKIKERVRKTYQIMHRNQTVDFVKSRQERWSTFEIKADVMTMLHKLDDLVDESDPDVDLPNSVHAFQTAERLRVDYPNLDWLHLTGLIHDIGKIMAFYDEPQWAVVGDTFPVGCLWGKSIVYREDSFVGNPDGADQRYNTEYGIYERNCGLDKVDMSWGHDEYLYRMLKHNNVSLPDEAFYMVRYHSFYPWHSGGDYMHLCNEKDLEMLSWVKLFNRYDLYTKSAEVPDVEAITPYYQNLIDKYMPGELSW